MTQQLLPRVTHLEPLSGLIGQNVEFSVYLIPENPLDTEMYFAHKFHFCKLVSLSSLFHNVGDPGSFPRVSRVLSSNTLKETIKLGGGGGGDSQ